MPSPDSTLGSVAADPPPPPPPVPETRENTRGERIALAAGGAAENAFQNALLSLSNPIFNIGMHVSPVMIGVAMAIPRFWEMVLDPWIGIRSDRTTSRWGKRVPCLVVSCFACMALFAAVWWVPQGWGAWSKGCWLIAFSFLFYTAYSFFAVPYAALTIDETREGPDRVRVMTTRVAFANISGLCLNWLYWLCQRDVFGSPVLGIRWVGLGFGIVVGLSGLLPVWMALRKLRARPACGVPAPGVTCAPAAAAATAAAATAATTAVTAAATRKSAGPGVFLRLLRLSSVRCLIVALMSILFGFSLVGHLGFYLIAYHACGGDLKQTGLVTGVSATVTTLLGIGICPVFSGMAQRIGKRPTLMLALATGTLASLSKWWLITPANPYLSIICASGISIGLTGFLSLMPSFLGEVSDDWTARTGEGCSGTLSALYGVAVKVGASLALMVTGYVLVGCGFRSEMQVSEMAAPIRNMRILYALIPALAGGVAMIAMSCFRLETPGGDA
ncbi:MAG: MFS transporter [Opitutaceae bacterium]|jgi:GPH family glycoside/pentoside/hexuronide:cation symporter|nr:MFS transporter [Opitutaceae bacterium]